MSAAHQNFSFDPDKLRAKYRRERDKRIRVDGNDQYIEVTGDFSHYIDDPYVEPGFERDAIQTQVGVLIIGGGFGGMLAAARLKDTELITFSSASSGTNFATGSLSWNFPCSYNCIAATAVIGFVME
jgi:cyclohexanone monooxygenase